MRDAGINYIIIILYIKLLINSIIHLLILYAYIYTITIICQTKMMLEIQENIIIINIIDIIITFLICVWCVCVFNFSSNNFILKKLHIYTVHN